MAHSRLNLTAMFDWIERCITAGEPTPLDDAICERFNFDSTEQARTLLADLADAGRITIRGHRDDRVITLGRTKGAIAATPRAAPPVRKADADVDRTAARIVEIAQRGRRPAAAVAAANAEALLRTVTTQQAAPKAALRKEVVMPAKSIQIPASADDVIAAIEAHADKNGVSLGLATASLIKRGLSTGAFEPAAAAATSVPATIDDFCEQLRALFASRDQSAVAALTAERDAAIARAEEAEAKISQMKALFA